MDRKFALYIRKAMSPRSAQIVASRRRRERRDSTSGRAASAARPSLEGMSGHKSGLDIPVESSPRRSMVVLPAADSRFRLIDVRFAQPSLIKH